MSAPRRLPPQDLGAEQGVLGGCLIHGADLVGQVADLLDPDDFYDRRHGKIYLAMHQLWDRGHPVDEITVTSYLNDAGQLTAVGGPVLLAEMADIAILPANVEHYARLVRDKSILRQMLNGLAEAEDAVYLAHDPDVLIAEVQERINRLSMKAHAGQLLDNRQVVIKAFADLEERIKQGKDPNAIPWGLAELDRITGGMWPGDMIVPAGRPGMGKSSFTLTVAKYVAVQLGLPVLFATGEQTEDQLVGWLICQDARVNTQNWSTGRLTSAELANAKMKREALERAPIYWMSGSATIRGISARAKTIKARHGRLGLVVVDYMQRFARSSKEEHVSDTSKAIKDMALDLRVPVIAVSQLNRKVEDRDPPTPTLSDLRSSGAIEQDANIVLFLYRPAYYDKAESGQEKLVHIGVAKNRGGPRGKAELYFTPENVRFDDENTPPQGAMF